MRGTSCLRFRMWSENDDMELFQLVRDTTDVFPYCAKTAGSPMQCREIICRYLQSPFCWAVVTRDGRLTGMVEFLLPDKEIRLWPVSSFRKQGYFQEVLNAAANHAFWELDLPLVWTGCAVDDEAAAETLRKCGFVSDHWKRDLYGNVKVLMVCKKSWTSPLAGGNINESPVI